MPSTTSGDLALYQPDDGEVGWCNAVNQNFEDIDTAITALNGAGGGGGIAAEYVTDYASLPATPGAGDIVLEAGGYLLIRSGSEWKAFQAPTLELPALETFTGLNDSAESVDTTHGNLVFGNATPGSVTAPNLAIQHTPFTSFAEGWLEPSSALISQSWAFGVVLRESATGKLTVIYVEMKSPRPTIRVRKYTGPTATPTDYTLASGGTEDDMLVPPRWFTLQKLGSNLYFDVSQNRYHYQRLLQTTATNFFTTGPDQCGVFVESSPANYRVGIAIHSWTST